jgi:hypothetical protein
VLPLKLAKDVDLTTGDLVAFERALLYEVGAHVAYKGLSDIRRQFDRFVAHGLKIGVPCRESESRRPRWSQPIATITNPALISTVAAMDIAISSGVGLIQSLRMAVPSMV